MNVLQFQIVKGIDIETLSDELAGFPAMILVTGKGTIEIVFERAIPEETRQHITKAMARLGALPVPAENRL